MSPGEHKAFWAAIVSSVSPNCEKMEPSKAISSSVLSFAILQASAEMVITRLQDCIEVTSQVYCRVSFFSCRTDTIRKVKLGSNNSAIVWREVFSCVFHEKHETALQCRIRSSEAVRLNYNVEDGSNNGVTDDDAADGNIGQYNLGVCKYVILVYDLHGFV